MLSPAKLICSWPSPVVSAVAKFSVAVAVPLLPVTPEALTPFSVKVTVRESVDVLSSVFWK